MKPEESLAVSIHKLVLTSDLKKDGDNIIICRNSVISITTIIRGRQQLLTKHFDLWLLQLFNDIDYLIVISHNGTPAKNSS